MDTLLWQEILLKLTREHHSKLSKVKKEDFVSYCLDSKIKTIVDHYLRNVRVTVKDSAVALAKKNEGNERFIAGDYRKSLKLYTDSIFSAEKNDENLPLAYANRSLVLLKMGYFLESLADIENARAYGYPKSKVEKLESRARAAEIQLSAEDKSKPWKKKFELPKVAGGINRNFASASALLSVNFDEIKGRHVIANKDIKAGKVLFVEKAFAFVVCSQCCKHCLKRTHAPVPCENCLDVTYCSLKCRNESWKSGHSFQCGFGLLFKSVGIAHLGLQVVIAASSNLNELKSKLANMSEPKYERGVVSFDSQGYDSVYNLVHHLTKFEENDLFQYALTALLLATYMKNHTDYFPPESGDEDLKLLTSTILRHILQMICNGHAIVENLIRGENYLIQVNEDQRVATGIFPSVSLLNHSCLPSVTISFFEDYIIVQAAKDIKKGEEVYNCYSTDARRMKRADRQEILSKQYFFDCNCEACTQAVDFMDKFTAFKCSHCNGPLVQRDVTIQEAVCIDCGKNVIVSPELILKSKAFYSLYYNGSTLFEFYTAKALKEFLKAWELGQKIFYRYHKDLSNAADRVAHCYATLGDYKKSLSYLKQSILSVKMRFGLFSCEMMAELNKWYDLKLRYLQSLGSTGNLTPEVEREMVAFNEAHEKFIDIFDGISSFKRTTAQRTKAHSETSLETLFSRLLNPISK